jgi:hypothetical protein
MIQMKNAIFTLGKIRREKENMEASNPMPRTRRREPGLDADQNVSCGSSSID